MHDDIIIKTMEDESSALTREIKQILFDIRIFCLESDSPLRAVPVRPAEVTTE